jgi:hypothetical protein
MAVRWLAATGGISPEQVALIFAVGLVLGTFPVVGFPTILCLIAAVALRLNGAALQAVNQLSSPLQWALLVPLARAGWKFPVSATAPVPWKICAVTLQAVTGWFVICVPMGILLYVCLLLFLRRREGSCFHGVESPAR